MKMPATLICFNLIFNLVCLILLTGLPAAAADMRQLNREYAARQEALIQQARDEKEQARKEANVQAAKIRNDRTALKKAIADLKKKKQALENGNQALTAEIKDLKQAEERLQADLAVTGAENREFEGAVRAHAKDLKSLLVQSLQSGLAPGRHEFLEPLLGQGRFPAMADVDRMVAELFNEIRLSGQVRKETGPMVDRDGREQTADLLILGNFTGVYRLDNEVGFLLYSDKSRRYFALSKLPPAKVAGNIRAYLEGREEAVYTDVSRGGAVRALAHQLNLAEQVPKGGAIVWPILVVLGLAVLILLERFFFFVTRQCNDEKLMTAVKGMIAVEDWDGCRAYLRSRRKRLIPKVLLTALALRDRTRPEIENALQEAILGEIPAVERFLSTLGMLAAISPLLGLLGTVTGMINTFHVITYYGTGDPRMMSGGISEALVTTMLGLGVAIPIMLVHTLLSRRVETLILKMEEKSVAFVNLIFKNTASDTCTE